MAGEMLGPTLLSIHNIRHFQRLMVDIRTTIVDDAWPSFEARWPVLQAPADAPDAGLGNPSRSQATEGAP